MDRNQIIEAIQDAAKALGVERLTIPAFRQQSGISQEAVLKHFDSWSDACAQAGINCERYNRKIELSEVECVQELKRVACLLGQSYLAKAQFDANARFSSYLVLRVFTRWDEALAAAELHPSPNFKKDIPLQELAMDFLRVCGELARIPTLRQLARRSSPVSHTFSGKHGGYDVFKKKAIDYLFSMGLDMPPSIRAILNNELTRLQSEVTTHPDPVVVSRPHYQGRTLKFRAFMYAPTCEHDVVQMFGAIAHELGFEIIGNRSAFPDCEARRKVDAVRERWEQCLIEYEFSSSDYRKHKHPTTGCDLIVCWMHNWKECPIEVLSLEEEIKNLDGWK